MGIHKSMSIPILVIFWVLVGSLLSAGTWNAQFQRTVQSAQFTEPEQQQLYELFTGAEKKQVPMDLLVLRLEEGTAKQVSPSTLYSALEKEVQAFNHTHNLIVTELGQEQAKQLLYDSAIWSRVATLHRQGVPDGDLKTLIGMFSQQKLKDKWNNFRYGGGLLIALRQRGIADGLSLLVVEALSQSTIPGEDYRAVLDLFNYGFSNRIPPEDIANRIIESAPRSRSVTMLERIVR